jgi:hypothetical protein
MQSVLPDLIVALGWLAIGLAIVYRRKMARLNQPVSAATRALVVQILERGAVNARRD